VSSLKKLSYLDIHTHVSSSVEDVITVKVLSQDELNKEFHSADFFCAGIHPWWLEEISEAQIAEFKNHIVHLVTTARPWAVGETGIDRLYPELLDQQKELFQWHWDLAEEHQLPLVIHNVRSGSDFLELLKTRKAQTPWIFHDFRGNEQLMRDLLRLHPQSYFSFGISLDNSPQIRELLPVVPIEHLFLETDAQKHLDIHDIYIRAADQLQLDLEFLKSQLWMNFRKITPYLLTPVI
jgi:TatD DNase family protein